MLEPVTIPIRFAGGVETKQDPHGVSPAKLLTLENGVFNAAISIGKRYGYDSVGKAVVGGEETPIAGGAGLNETATPDTTTAIYAVSGGKRLATRDDELLLFEEQRAYSLADTGWLPCGDVVGCELEHWPEVKTTTEQFAPDYAQAGGIGVYAWENDGTVEFSVIDSTTRKTIVRPTQLAAAGDQPKVLAIDDETIHIYYHNTTSEWIYCLVIPTEFPKSVATPSPTILVENIDTAHAVYDVDSPENGMAVIAWQFSPTQMAVGYVHRSGVLSGPSYGDPSYELISATGTSAPGSGGLSVARFKGSPNGGVYKSTTPLIGVVWDSTGGLAYSLHLVTTLAQSVSGYFLSAGTFAQVTCAYQGSALLHIVTCASSTIMWFWVYPDGTKPTSPVTLARGMTLASKPFFESGVTDQVYFVAHKSSTLYSTYLLMRTDGLVVGRYLSGIAGDALTSTTVPHAQTGTKTYINESLGTWTMRSAMWASVYKMALESEDDDVYAEQGIRHVTVDFAPDAVCQTAQLGKSLYMSGGGMMHVYDGDSFVEIGGHWAIDDVAAPTAAGGGSLTASSTYLYRFVVEYVLANGDVVRGPVSTGTTVALGVGETKLTFAIPTIRVTEMTSPRGEIRIGVYRTESNDTAYYRVSSLDPTATGNNGYVANTPGSATVSFVDAMSDTDLIGQEPLYTSGGILNNDPCPVGSVVVAGKNRLFFTDPTDPLLVRYSQELAEGYAAELSPYLSAKIDPAGGDITGLAVMDDVVIVLKENAVFAFGGPGPLANPNAGGGFSSPVLIPSAAGCTDQRSVAVTPAGVVFAGTKGIYLVDRGRNVSYIGAPVEDYNDQEIASVTVLEDRHEVRFLTTSGVTLMWDYLFDQWSTFTNHEGLDSVNRSGTYYYLRNDGEVWQETPGEYGDIERAIPFVLETAWIKLRDVYQGFQMIWELEILGTYISSHTLKVWIQYDYEPGWYQAPWELDPSEFYDPSDYGDGVYGDGPYGGEQGNVGYQFKLHVAEECEAFRLRFSFEDGDLGACATLSEVLVHGAVSGPRKTLGDTRSY